MPKEGANKKELWYFVSAAGIDGNPALDRPLPAGQPRQRQQEVGGGRGPLAGARQGEGDGGQAGGQPPRRRAPQSAVQERSGPADTH